jgi:hypothetical protein
VLFTKYNWKDHIKKDELYRTCSMNWKKGERVYVIYAEDRRKETTRKTKTWVGCVGEWIILRRIFERQDEVVWSRLVWLRIKKSGGLF